MTACAVSEDRAALAKFICTTPSRARLFTIRLK